MKVNREIRIEALKRVLNGRWFGRMLVVMVIVSAASNLANGVVDAFYKTAGIQTWMDYMAAKAQAMRSGLEYAVPSAAVARQMCGSTAFQMFIGFIFGGIAVYGMTCVVLKAAKEDERGWCRDSMGGFARPLGVAWLGFVLFVRIFLWSLLLFVPGVVASYRYSQCWNLKVEHPEWGASQCLAESGRMMAGRKMQRFRLDLYFLVIAVALILAILPVELLAVSVGGLFGGLLDMVSRLLSMAAIVLMVLWMSVARAVFYRALKLDREVGNVEVRHD